MQSARWASLGLVWLLAACDTEVATEREPETFRYDTFGRQTLSVHVTDDEGSPVAGVRIVVRRVDGDRTAGPPLWLGRSDDRGFIEGAFAAPPGASQVAVSLFKPGFRGPYDDPEWAAQMGKYAPASHMTIPSRELADLEITLEEAQ